MIEQKPVAWATDLNFDYDTEIIPASHKGRLGTSINDIPLYISPPRGEWQGLTDKEMSEAMDYWSDPVRSAYGGAHSADGEYVGMIDTWRYIEAKLKEKNYDKS
jgi:hypothetical protein